MSLGKIVTNAKRLLKRLPLFLRRDTTPFTPIKINIIDNTTKTECRAIIDAAATFSLGGPLTSIIAQLELVVDDGQANFVITINSVPRDAPESEPSFLYFNVGTLQPIAKEDAARVLRDAIHKIMAHELDELMLFDGQRLFDPHLTTAGLQ